MKAGTTWYSYSGTKKDPESLYRNLLVLYLEVLGKEFSPSKIAPLLTAESTEMEIDEYRRYYVAACHELVHEFDTQTEDMIFISWEEEEGSEKHRMHSYRLTPEQRTYPEEVQDLILDYYAKSSAGFGFFMLMILSGLGMLFIPNGYIAAVCGVICFCCTIPAAKGKGEYESAKAKMNKAIRNYQSQNQQTAPA